MLGDKLNLPAFGDSPGEPLLRLVDRTDAWIEHDIRYFFDRETCEREKLVSTVNVRFTLDEQE